MATTKQTEYLRSLMSEAGLMSDRGSLYGSAKRLPHNPTQRERSAGFDAWARRLTTRQASEVIDSLIS